MLAEVKNPYNGETTFFDNWKITLILDLPRQLVS
jgi:hypothetical protein